MKTGRVLRGILMMIPILLFSISCKPKQLKRMNTVIEMNVGQTQDVMLVNGEVVKLAFNSMDIVRDSVRLGIRDVKLRISVDGQEAVIGSGNYYLPVIVGKVRIDCPVLKEHTATSSYYTNGVLGADARFRL